MGTMNTEFALHRPHAHSKCSYVHVIAEEPAKYVASLASHQEDGRKLRLGMALIEGLQDSAAENAVSRSPLMDRLCRAAGQAKIGNEPESLRKRLKWLSRAADQNLAEQLHLLVAFDEQRLYEREGCRNMLIWMGIHLKVERAAAYERLRVARALRELPILTSLFTLGQVSYSQLREVTRCATRSTDAEFATAVLELSVSETIEYCRRFRLATDAAEDAAVFQSDGEDAAQAQAEWRAFERRAMYARDIDAHSKRIVLELPNDLAAEFIASLEQVDDWIREGGEGGESKLVGRSSRPDVSTMLSTSRDADAAVAEPKASRATTSCSVPSVPSVSGSPTPLSPASSSNESNAQQRRADAAVLMSRRSLALAGEAVAMADRYRVHVDVDVEDLKRGPVGFDELETVLTHSSPDKKGVPCVHAHAPVQRSRIRGQKPISGAMARRIASCAGFTLLATDGDDEIIGTKTIAAPFTKRQLRALNARDRCCQMPGCGATRHLHGHHVVHREHGGRSNLSNAALVCGPCHRFLHEGGFRLERVGEEDIGSLSAPVTLLASETVALSQARVKVGKVRRFRLFGSDGRELGSISAAREQVRERSLVPDKLIAEYGVAWMKEGVGDAVVSPASVFTRGEYSRFEGGNSGNVSARDACSPRERDKPVNLSTREDSRSCVGDEAVNLSTREDGDSCGGDEPVNLSTREDSRSCAGE